MKNPLPSVIKYVLTSTYVTITSQQKKLVNRKFAFFLVHSTGIDLDGKLCKLNSTLASILEPQGGQNVINYGF